MSKLYDLQELVDHTGLPERTVRYYLAKVLDAPGGTRGRKAFYPQETLDQLKLAKQILMGPFDPKRGEVKPSLRDFKRWLKSQSTEEISSMAEMPYRIKPKKLLEAAAPQVAKTKAKEEDIFADEVFASAAPAYMLADPTDATDSAAQYLRRFMGKDKRTKPAPGDRPHQATPWESFQFGNDLEIKVRKRLSPAQKRQLDLAGRLLQSMLEE